MNAEPVHGDIQTTYPGQVTYRCLPGYQTSREDTVRCSEEGVWISATGQLPTCDPIDCGPPVTNMQIVAGSEFTFGSTLTLTCPEGMRASGPSRVTCSSVGVWSPEPGTCESKSVDCGREVVEH